MEHVATNLVDRQFSPTIENSRNEAHASGVSWPAVIAGAFVAAALSLCLLALGTGLGLSAVSPWSGEGASASTIGAAGIVWLIIMQVIAAAMGGYLAGRLRTKWTGVHTDEVFFRDTAHGFLVWAVGAVITAAFLASAASSMIGGTVKAGAAAVAGASTGGAAMMAGAKGQGDEQSTNPHAYFVDALFRTDGSNAEPIDASTRAESGRILANAQADMPAADKTYLAQLIAKKTGISQADAEKRVSDAQAQVKSKEMEARQAADTARKAAAHLSLWIFLALLIGAFSASIAATIGGRQRDHVLA